MSSDRTAAPVSVPLATGSSSLAKILARNMIFNFSAGLGVKVLSFAFSIYAVRQLGDSAYGRYATALALVGLLSMLAELGVTQYGIREIAKDKSRTTGLLSAMMVVRLFLSLFAIAICGLAALLLGYDSELVWAVLLASSVFVVYAIQGPLEVVLSAYERLDFSSTLMAGNHLLFVAAGFVLLVAGLGYFGLIYASLLAIVVSTALTWVVLRRWVVRPTLQLRPSECRDVLLCGVPFALSGMGILISNRVGTVLLSLWRSPEEVGWYAVAFNLVTALLLLWAGFGGALIPSLSRESVTNRAVIGRVFEKAAMAILGLYLPIALGMTIVADPLVRLLYTDEFAASVVALQILVWILPVRTLAFFCGAVAWVIGKERSMARIYLVSAFVETALNAALIQHLGINATALAAVSASMLSLAQFLILLRRDVVVMPASARLLGIIVASATMGGIALGLTEFFRPHLVIVVVVSAASYAGMLFMLRVITVVGARQASSLVFSSIRRFQAPSAPR
ncbi:MAG: flippase [Chloroflexota bacterium]